MANDRFDLKRPDVFKTRITETVQAPGQGFAPFIEERTTPPTVRVDQTPDEARATRNANYPRYNWLDVQNLPNRKRV